MRDKIREQAVDCFQEQKSKYYSFRFWVNGVSWGEHLSNIRLIPGHIPNGLSRSYCLLQCYTEKANFYFHWFEK